MSSQLKYSSVNSSPAIESVLLAPDISKVISRFEDQTFIFQRRKSANTPVMGPGVGKSRTVEELIREYSLYLEQEDSPQAIEALRRIIKLNPSSDAYTKIGLRYWEIKDLNRAAQALEKAVRLDPSNATAQFHLGTVYITPFLTYGDSSKLRKAIKPVKEAIRFGKYVPMAHHYLGIVYEGLKNWRSAEEHYQTAIELDSRLEVAYLKLAYLYTQMAEINPAEREHYYLKAIATYQELIKANPKNSDAYRYMSWDYQNLGQLEAALEACERAVEIDKNNFFALATLGLIYLDSSRYEDAKSVFQQIIQTDPKLVSAYLEGWEAQTKADAFWADVYTGYGVACMEIYRQQESDLNEGADKADPKLLQEAEFAFNKALKVDPHSVNAHYDQAALYYWQNRLPEAQETIRRLLEIDPSDETTKKYARSLLEEQLKEKLHKDGLLKRIREPITDFGPYHNRRLIVVQGKPVSETLVEDRR